MNTLKAVALSILGTSIVACGVAPDDVDSSESNLIDDVRSVERRPDGTYDVTCVDGRIETGVTAAELRADKVCNPAPKPKPTGPERCTGAPATLAQLRQAFADPALRSVAPITLAYPAGKVLGTFDGLLEGRKKDQTSFVPEAPTTPLRLIKAGTSPYFQSSSWTTGVSGAVGLFATAGAPGIELRFRTDAPVADNFGYRQRLIVMCDLREEADGTVTAVEGTSCRMHGIRGKGDLDFWGSSQPFDGTPTGGRPTNITLTDHCVSFEAETIGKAYDTRWSGIVRW